MSIVAYFVIGLLCGHAWPHAAGPLTTAASLLCALLCLWADNSPDDIFDLLLDYSELIIWRVYLPSVAGLLVGALTVVLA